MKTCPACQQTYPDDVDSCPRDGSRLVPEVREERECPYCAELILKKARVCKHCGRDVEPLVKPDAPVQVLSLAPPVCDICRQPITPTQVANWLRGRPVHDSCAGRPQERRSFEAAGSQVPSASAPQPGQASGPSAAMPPRLQTSGAEPGLGERRTEPWPPGNRKSNAPTLVAIGLGLLALFAVVGIGYFSGSNDASSVTEVTSEPQNDTEGYDQHPWDCTIDEFRHAVADGRPTSSPAYAEHDSDEGYTDLSGNGFPSSDEFGAHSYLGYYTVVVMHYLEQVPSIGFGRRQPLPGEGYFADPLRVPDEIIAFYDKSNEMYYFFYKKRLAYVSIPVDSDPAETLRSKHGFIGHSSFHSGDTFSGEYAIDLFKRGDTNTRIYSVHYRREDVALEQRFLIYIPTSTLYRLTAEVRAKVQAAKQEEIREQERTEQETTGKVQ